MQDLLKKYRNLVIGLVVLALGQSFLSLLVPKLISRAINTFVSGNYQQTTIIWEFGGLALAILVFGGSLVFAQTRVGERVAKDMRNQLADSVAKQDFMFVQTKTPSVLLTNFSSDIDAIKMFVSQVVPTILSSMFIIFGAAFFLVSIHLRLGLAVLTIVPLIGFAMFMLFSRVRPLFTQSQKVIDRLNAVINESILGAALIRVLNAQALEYDRFVKTNSDAKDTGMKILRMFAGLIPIITLIANSSMLIMVLLGGHYIIKGQLNVGDFAAFMNYVVILIFPIFLLGFMSSIMARATASYARVAEVLNAPQQVLGGNLATDFQGEVIVKDVTMTYETKSVLKGVSFTIKPGTKTAIIGPTAAGKTQLIYLLSGLIVPTSGAITYDGVAINDYSQAELRKHLGIVFQDSALFNMSLRQNIAFGQDLDRKDIDLAIETAELKDFIASLPEGLETQVSERGTSLSGGQKQRVMLARALARNPKILYLDDFTARVDVLTEKKILANIAKNYPNLTLVSVTQKVAAAEAYEQIIVLMEGEIVTTGTHQELLQSSPEYAQIVDSQKSTHAYELSAE